MSLGLLSSQPNLPREQLQLDFVDLTSADLQIVKEGVDKRLRTYRLEEHYVSILAAKVDDLHQLLDSYTVVDCKQAKDLLA